MIEQQMHDLTASQLCGLFMVRSWSRDYLTCLQMENNICSPISYEQNTSNECLTESESKVKTSRVMLW